MTKALILVDFEKEWVNPDSEYYVGDISNVISKVNQTLAHCREHEYKIIFTRHIEEDSENEFAPGSQNIELISDIDSKENDIDVTKNRISPFYKTDLEKHLEGVDEIIVCGILTNLCVRSVVQDAYDRDFDITVLTDACVAFDQETHDFTIKDLQNTREEIHFTTVEKFITK